MIYEHWFYRLHACCSVGENQRQKASDSLVSVSYWVVLHHRTMYICTSHKRLAFSTSYRFSSHLTRQPQVALLWIQMRLEWCRAFLDVILQFNSSTFLRQRVITAREILCVCSYVWCSNSDFRCKLRRLRFALECNQSWGFDTQPIGIREVCLSALRDTSCCWTLPLTFDNHASYLKESNVLHSCTIIT